MFGKKKSKEEKRAIKAEKQALKEKKKQEKAFKKELRDAFNPKAVKNEDVRILRNRVLFPAFGMSAGAMSPMIFLDPTFVLPTVAGTLGLLYAGASGMTRIVNHRHNKQPATWRTLSGQKVKGTVLEEAQYRALQEAIFKLDDLEPKVKTPEDRKVFDKLSNHYHGFKTKLFKKVKILDAGPYAASSHKITFLNTRADIPKPPKPQKRGFGV